MMSNVLDESLPAVRARSQGAKPLSRSQVMERIISINPTASVQFLARFADRALRGYLDHLSVLQEPRGRSSAPWIRPADSPAIVVRVPND